MPLSLCTQHLHTASLSLSLLCLDAINSRKDNASECSGRSSPRRPSTPFFICSFCKMRCSCSQSCRINNNSNSTQTGEFSCKLSERNYTKIISLRKRGVITNQDLTSVKEFQDSLGPFFWIQNFIPLGISLSTQLPSPGAALLSSGWAVFKLALRSLGAVHSRHWAL